MSISLEALFVVADSFPKKIRPVKGLNGLNVLQGPLNSILDDVSLSLHFSINIFMCL